MDFSAEKVYELVMNPETETIQKYDDAYKDGRNIERFEAGDYKFSVGYSRYKGTMLVSDRDFCVGSVSFTDSEGRIISSAISVEHPECPVVKKVVRAQLSIGGWLIVPDQEDPENKSYSYYITNSDLKGSIPKSLVNSSSKGQGFLPMKMNELLKKM